MRGHLNDPKPCVCEQCVPTGLGALHFLWKPVYLLLMPNCLMIWVLEIVNGPILHNHDALIICFPFSPCLLRHVPHSLRCRCVWGAAPHSPARPSLLTGSPLICAQPCATPLHDPAPPPLPLGPPCKALLGPHRYRIGSADQYAGMLSRRGGGMCVLISVMQR